MKKLLSTKRGKYLFIVGTLIITLSLVTVAYAFLEPIIGPASRTSVDLTGDSLDSLTFSEGDPLVLQPGSHNLADGMGNISSETRPSATLVANETSSSATNTYRVYFKVNENTYQYSSGNTPELILEITKPDGTKVTSLTGLTPYTSDGLTGFDITTYKGVIEVASSEEITTTSSTTGTTEEWMFKVTMLNLPVDQSINADKTIDAEVHLRHDELPDFILDVAYNSQANTVPTGLGYTTGVSCDTINATWNQKYQRIEVNFTTPYSSCSVNFEEPASVQNLNDYIISLSGTTQGEGQLVNENGYRYQGKDPNNYIWFNNELWRIIGVFDNNSHGITGQNLVKIIREDPIGGLVWDTENLNDWNASSLKELLNNEYYNALNGNASANCRGYSTTVPANCDYTVYGLQSDYRELMEEVTWYLGALENSGTAETVYNVERSDTVYSGRPLSGTGKIGIMYMSDYGYSVLSSSCARSTNLNSYDSSICAGSSWLYGNSYEWTIMPPSFVESLAWFINRFGNASITSAAEGLAVRPVLYLKSSVNILEGSGSKVDPYILK